MQNSNENIQRRTSTDAVFDRLHEEIVTLQLLPGTKLSEVDIAKRFGVSRQPVRDAFNRLENLDFLLIRPQRATEVRGFSIEQIMHTRFVRLAVELEVVRQACSIWDEARAEALEENIQQQRQTIADDQQDQFHKLDYQFHRLICELGNCPLAFKTVKECKQKVDRLCVLSLGRENECETVLDDHVKLAEALKSGSVKKAHAILRQHLSRLDDTIKDIHLNHSEYFE